LWIIALFIALSEATAGIAAIITSGPARLIFAIFAVSFPSIVFIVFVWLLVKHAPNLYAPGQYSRDITPEMYRAGIRRDERIVFGRALAESMVPLLPDIAAGGERSAVVEQVARNFEIAVEEASVTVLLQQLKPQAEPLQIPVTEETKVYSLLDDIYYALAPTVSQNTYNKSWVLADGSGKYYTEIGTGWARKANWPRDTRPIAAVGISPGTTLTVVAKRRADRDFHRDLSALVSNLRSRLKRDGVSVEGVNGQQLPRLAVQADGLTYGLYAMPGSPSEHWIELARAAAGRLELKLGDAARVIPVLALNQQPPAQLVDAATAASVEVVWIYDGELHGAPWHLADGGGGAGPRHVEVPVRGGQ
jgi:hypothetical protein